MGRHVSSGASTGQDGFSAFDSICTNGVVRWRDSWPFSHNQHIVMHEHVYLPNLAAIASISAPQH